MTTNHTAPTIITYGSCYGSTEHYAKKFAEHTGFMVLPFREAKNLSGYARVVHFGALYAGGVLGLRQILSRLTPNTELVLVTVGLADVQDGENIQSIRNALRRQVPEEILEHTRIFHLQGAIDYSRLQWGHRIMMALLYAKAKGQEKKTAETRAMLETYGKKVSFVDDAALIQLKNCL